MDRDRSRRGVLRPGTNVRVRSRYQGAWVGGFEVAGVDGSPGGSIRRYRVRRVSDRTELPAPLPENDLAPTDLDGYDGQFWPGMPERQA